VIAGEHPVDGPPAVAIINPKSATGRTARAWRRIRSRLDQEFVSYETRAPDHAIELTTAALKRGVRTVIAVGGDGTINEVVNGFFERGRPIEPEAVLGVIPLGTGSDFRRSIDLPGSEILTSDAIRARRTQPIDLMRIQYTRPDGAPGVRYSINVTSFGMGGAVASRANRSSKMLGGRIAFLLATALTMLSYRGKDVAIESNGATIRARVTNVAVGNGQYHGGGMWVCPDARLDDGLLDVSVIGYLNALQIARDLSMLYNGRIKQHAAVQSFRTTWLRAESVERTLIEIDGEPLGILPVEIEVMPKAIRILIAP
jgi:YegS/Rv2252/BmrU family lipid kinase